MRPIHVFLTLSILFEESLGQDCQWDVRLCDLGDPRDPKSTCTFDSPLSTLSGGIEVQQFSTNVQAILDTLVDQPVDTKQGAIKYYGFPYYLRVDLRCGTKEESMRTMQEALYTGLTPEIVLSFQEPVHPSRLKPQRLQTVLTPAPLVDTIPCDSDLCQLGWYAPMPIINGSVVYRIKVASNGQGQHVPENSFSVNVNGFVRTRERRKQEISFGMKMPSVADMLSLDTPSRPLWFTLGHAPVLILPGIPGFKAVLMTATDFQHTSVIEVDIESCWAGSLSCPQAEFSSMIVEAISTESALFIRQNQLVHRFVGNYSLLPLKGPPSASWEPVLRSVCVSGLVPVFMPFHGREFFYIVGGGWQKGTLYRAEVYDGEVTYMELVDSSGRTACEFMNDPTCRVLWAAQDSMQNLTDMVLVELTDSRTNRPTYTLLILRKDFDFGDAFPVFIPKDSGHSFTAVTTMQENSSVPLVLRAMTFNPFTSSLYMWGNSLLCSLDMGRSYLFFTGFPLDKMIKYFTLSYQRDFAFVTDTEELWWGQEGVGNVMRVNPSLGWQAFSSLQAMKGHSTYTSNSTLLTIFYDWDKQLNEVVYTLDSDGNGHVVKRVVPVPDILSFNLFSNSPQEVHHLESFSAFSFPLPCPFFSEHLDDLPHPEPYNRIQQYVAGPPLVTTLSGLHTTASLATYQGLLNHLLILHSDYIMDIGDPVHNPIWRWWKDQMVYEDYYFYMASNGVASSGFNVEMGSYQRSYLSSERFLPDTIYLDRQETFSFSVYLACGAAEHLAVEEKALDLNDINYIWISAEVSNDDYIRAKVTRKEFFNMGAVVYEVKVMDRGMFPGQALAGERLQPVSLLLKVGGSEMQCYQETASGMALTGQHSVPVYIGCPPGNRLAFDISTTMEQCSRLNKRYFNCLNPDPIMPCFFFNNMFYPFFLIQDMVSGRSEPFLGSYTFKVVGGGPFSKDNIRLYSPEEVLMSNSLNYSSSRALVWMFDDVTNSYNVTKDGFAVLQGATNRIKWLCQRYSPCGDLAVLSLNVPDYYFVIEISNKGVDLSTYCDYALRFTLHVHGFPLDPETALFYMLMTFATLSAILFSFVVYNCCGPNIKRLAQLTYMVRKNWNKSNSDSDISLRDSDHSVHKDLE